MTSIDMFKKNYVKAIQEGYAAIFAGAGLSCSSGYVDWKNLLRDIADEINLCVDKEHDLISVAQYYCNEKRNRSRLNTVILNDFSSEGHKNESLEILSQLTIHTYWTTNYDHLIEDTLRSKGMRVDVKTTPQSLATVLDGRDAVVYKMHGDCTSPEECVITKEDYETYHFSRQIFSTALQGDLVSKTFLFIGFSFDDPNLNYVLSRIRALLNDNQREHYCFFEKIRKKRHETDEEFEYRKHKQYLKISDLRRYGISAVLLDSYSEIPTILHDIAMHAKKKCVFLSGSAAVYGTWAEEQAITLLRLITEKLCDKGYKIMTGHGKGVGSYVISSVLEKYGSNIYEIERHLVIRAFPFQDKNRDNYAEIVTEYRNGFFQQAGVSIFVFGNKESVGDVCEAEGMLQEFALAQEHKNYIIPIGTTGYIAEKIYNLLNNNRSEYSYLDDYWDVLANSKDPKEISDCVVSILDRIQRTF